MKLPERTARFCTTKSINLYGTPHCKESKYCLYHQGFYDGSLTTMKAVILAAKLQAEGN